MNKKILICALLLGGLPYLKADLIDIDIAIGVVTCTGGDNVCSATVNAVGDLVVLDVTGKPITKIAPLTTEEMFINLSLPTKPNEFKLYSFTPTQGALAGKEIYLLLQNVPQRIGTRRADKTVIKVSRQIAGEESDQWIEIGDLSIDKTEVVKSVPFILTNYGTLATFDTSQVKGPVKIDTTKALPEGVKKIEFLAGSDELIVAT